MEAQEEATPTDRGNLVGSSLPKTAKGYVSLSPQFPFTKFTNGFMHLIYVAANCPMSRLLRAATGKEAHAPGILITSLLEASFLITQIISGWLHIVVSHVIPLSRGLVFDIFSPKISFPGRCHLQARSVLPPLPLPHSKQ